MKKDITILNHLHFIVDIGVIGIEEIITKVQDNCLEKIMLDQKKEYLVIRKMIVDLMAEYEEKPKEIGPITRTTNEIYTNMKLVINENDQEIAKMMLEGTNKGLIEATTYLHEHDYKNEEITKIINKLLKILNKNTRELKKYL